MRERSSTKVSSSSAMAAACSQPVERSGDEPQMLARAVPRAAVLVSSSRYAAGRIAESRLGCTVHVLDDGFQHFDLMRDIDLLVAPDASESTRTLPFGRLREPLDAASAADALLVDDTCVVPTLPKARRHRAAARLEVPASLSHSRAASPGPSRSAGVCVCGHREARALLRRSRKGRLEADRPPVVRRSSSLFGARARRDRARGEVVGRRGDPDDRKGHRPFGV